MADSMDEEPLPLVWKIYSKVMKSPQFLVSGYLHTNETQLWMFYSISVPNPSKSFILLFGRTGRID